MFLTLILPILAMLYLYGVVTTAKYDRVRQQLDEGRTTTRPDTLGLAAIWPFGLLVEPSAYKGMLYPTLWMWDRYRNEYPEIKRQNELDRKEEADIRKKQVRREREVTRGVLRRDDMKSEIKHTRDMAMLQQELDALHEQAINDYPPAIEAGATYDGDEPPPVPESADSPDLYCFKHEKWEKESPRSAARGCRF